MKLNKQQKEEMALAAKIAKEAEEKEFYGQNLFSALEKIYNFSAFDVIIVAKGFVLEQKSPEEWSYSMPNQVKKALKAVDPWFINDYEEFFLSKDYDKQSFQNLQYLLGYLDAIEESLLQEKIKEDKISLALSKLSEEEKNLLGL